VGTRVAAFTTAADESDRHWRYSTVRRGLTVSATNSVSNGKRSPETMEPSAANGLLVFTPEEILDRRRAVGLPAYPKGVESEHGAHSLGRAIRRVVDVEI